MSADRPEQRGTWVLTDQGLRALGLQPDTRRVPVATPADLDRIAQENRAALAALNGKDTAA